MPHTFIVILFMAQAYILMEGEKMDYYGIKEVKGEAVITEFRFKKKERARNFLNVTAWSLAVLNLVAYALVASQIV